MLLTRLAFGLRIHWFVVPFRETTAPTSALVAVSVSVKVVAVTPLTASLKVAVMLFPTGTAVALASGARAVTVGAGLTGPVAGIVWSANRSCSTLRTVSVPSSAVPPCGRPQHARRRR